jgi:predicted CXXCH cytochrome family protein
MHSGASVRKAVGLASLLILSACTPQSRYRVLKVFFDGVPEPEIKLTAYYVPGSGPGGKTVSPASVRTVASRHPDFRDNNCKSCHDTRSATFLAAEKDKICFSCHGEEAFKGSYVHGPVAIGDCLSCHKPHESEYPHLLSAPGNAVCYQCHEKSSLSTKGEHAKAIETSCLDCHAPHVSETKFFLRKRQG